MAATAAQIAELRRKVAEPTTTTYSDVLLTDFIERYAVPDSRGLEPAYLDYTTTPPTWTENESWIATYDLNAAAAEIWEEKAAAVACSTDFDADGGSYSLSQRHAQYLKQAQRFRSRSCPGALRMARVERVVGRDGTQYETTPIVDALNNGTALNAPDQTP